MMATARPEMRSSPVVAFADLHYPRARGPQLLVWPFWLALTSRNQSLSSCPLSLLRAYRSV